MICDIIHDGRKMQSMNMKIVWSKKKDAPFVVRRKWPLLDLFSHLILLIFSSISRLLR
jgi:hypothetical protein